MAKDEVTIEVIAGRVFQARDVAHRQHWITTSYAQHVALGAFYDDVITAIDAVIENYQGMFNTRIGLFDVTTEPVKDIVAYLTDEQDWIESHIDELSQGSPSIGNLIQSLVSVYSKTIFLLGMK
jgi:hypothetical protein